MNGEVIRGDASLAMRALARRPDWDPERVVVLTDPPWPDCEHVDIDGAEDAVKVWRRVARTILLVADRLILWLGRNIDPREMLTAVPAELPFATTVTLRFVPPGYRGPFMSGDVAYVFGRMRMPRRADGSCERILPGEIISSCKRDQNVVHPCPRSPMHAAGLVRSYCAGADVIFDPFCGSGTTLVAASNAGIPYIGIDSDKRWVAEAKARLERAESQQLLPLPIPAEQIVMVGQ